MQCTYLQTKHAKWYPFILKSFGNVVWVKIVLKPIETKVLDRLDYSELFRTSYWWRQVYTGKNVVKRWKKSSIKIQIKGKSK